MFFVVFHTWVFLAISLCRFWQFFMAFGYNASLKSGNTAVIQGASLEAWCLMHLIIIVSGFH